MRLAHVTQSCCESCDWYGYHFEDPGQPNMAVQAIELSVGQFKVQMQVSFVEI